MKLHSENIISAQECSNRLKENLQQLQDGEVSKEELIENIKSAALLLETVFTERSAHAPSIDEDIFSDYTNSTSNIPESVQEWIASTFTRRNTLAKPPRQRLRSIVNAVRIGIAFDKIYRKASPSDSHCSQQSIDLSFDESNALRAYFKESLNDWNIDIFTVNELSEGHALKAIGYQLLYKHGFISKFRIPMDCLENFLNRLEEGYSKYKKSIPQSDPLGGRGSDLPRDHLIEQDAGLFTDLEIFAAIFAALIHDFEHTGTTNAYHVTTETDLALLYNDKSVLENFHISAVFMFMRDTQYNILANLNRDDYKEFRTLTVDMVLATDMSVHFSQLQRIKETILMPENLTKIEILSLVLHSADISHPGSVGISTKNGLTCFVKSSFDKEIVRKSLDCQYRHCAIVKQQSFLSPK